MPKISEIVPAPQGMHRGALAPKWVFEAETPLEEPAHSPRGIGWNVKTVHMRHLA